MDVPSPTVRQRELGTRLRAYRNALGLTVEDVAAQLLCSPAKISRAETGTRRASQRDVRDLCRIYGVSEADTTELMELARMAREPGWWTEYADLKLQPYIGLEQEAWSITFFSMYCFPGLLQTEAYARAMIRGVLPKIDPKVLDQRVEARLRRQQILSRPSPPRFRVLLDQAALARRVGGPEVMAGQLDNVLRQAQAGTATVQVIPFDVGAYASPDSSFVLLELREPLQSVVFVEGLLKGQYYEKRQEIDRYAEVVEDLRDSALSPRDSLTLISEFQSSYAAER